jgi:predicted dehydrogenase
VSAAARPRVPRLGFLGVGWIGRHRLRAIAASGAAEVAAVADQTAEAAEQASREVGRCRSLSSLDELLALDLDGLVIATPSALHAEQAAAALERGVAVFCQKPLGRDAVEAQRVVDAARRAGRLLGVDLSYRHVAGMPEVRRLVAAGELGHIYAARLAFHNAYGPDKPWFYDARLSGGGCVMDLGIHLVDLALWVLGFPPVARVSSSLRSGGQELRGREEGRVEDYAAAQLELGNGTSVQLACSWHLPAGQDCVIEASFFGTRGGASLRNLDGSFYDFTVERLTGTRRETLASAPDAWGGRAAVAWARALAAGAGYDPAIESIVEVQATLDRIYRP